jgi:hypothetical protein
MLARHVSVNVKAGSAQLNRTSRAVSDLATRGAPAGILDRERRALLAAASSCKMRATHMRNPVVERARRLKLTYDELARRLLAVGQQLDI